MADEVLDDNTHVTADASAVRQCKAVRRAQLNPSSLSQKPGRWCGLTHRFAVPSPREAAGASRPVSPPGGSPAQR